MDRARCQSTNRDGGPCGGEPLKGGVYCVFHDPDRREKMAEGRRAGGHGASNQARAAKRIPADIRDVLNDLYETMSDLRAGALPKGRATEVATVARAIVAAYEVGAVESRLERLESLLDEGIA